MPEESPEVKLARIEERLKSMDEKIDHIGEKQKEFCDAHNTVSKDFYAFRTKILTYGSVILFVVTFFKDAILKLFGVG